MATQTKSKAGQKRKKQHVIHNAEEIVLPTNTSNFYDNLRAGLFNSLMADLKNPEIRSPALYTVVARVLEQNSEKLSDDLPMSATRGLAKAMKKAKGDSDTDEAPF